MDEIGTEAMVCRFLRSSANSVGTAHRTACSDGTLSWIAAVHISKQSPQVSGSWHSTCSTEARKGTTSRDARANYDQRHRGIEAMVSQLAFIERRADGARSSPG